MNHRELSTTPQQYAFLKGLIDQALEKPPRDDNEAATAALARYAQTVIEGMHTVAYNGRTSAVQRAAKERLKVMANDIHIYEVDAIARMMAQASARQMKSRWWPVISRLHRIRAWAKGLRWKPTPQPAQP